MKQQTKKKETEKTSFWSNCCYRWRMQRILLVTSQVNINLTQCCRNEWLYFINDYTVKFKNKMELKSIKHECLLWLLLSRLVSIIKVASHLPYYFYVSIGLDHVNSCIYKTAGTTSKSYRDTFSCYVIAYSLLWRDLGNLLVNTRLRLRLLPFRKLESLSSLWQGIIV